MCFNNELFCLSEIQDILVNSAAFNTNQQLYIRRVVINSNEAIKDCLFVAINGTNNDGNKYIIDAINNGARCIICEYIPNDIDVGKFSNIAFFVVKSSILALQELACYRRNKLSTKVIGITGNIGKTSTREMMALGLKSFYKVFSSEKNYNNHIGLPLTIVNAPSNVECLLLEMGMNHTGEIDLLSKIAKPDIAIITKIATAHIGNFESIHEIVKAKAEIFNGMNPDGFVILDNSGLFYNDLSNYARSKNIKNIITVGNENADIFIKTCELCDDFKIRCTIVVRGKEICFKMNTPSKHNVFNALFVFAVGLILKLDLEVLLSNLASFQNVSGRGNMETITTVHGKTVTIINDCYNSSPEALKAAILTLHELKTVSKNIRTIAVIGDMLELGHDSCKYHREIATILQKYRADSVICIGRESRAIFDNLPGDMDKKYLLNNDEFVNIIGTFQDGDMILFKASHGMHFNELIDKLKSLDR